MDSFKEEMTCQVSFVMVIKFDILTERDILNFNFIFSVSLWKVW